jgi:hypothetical protein
MSAGKKGAARGGFVVGGLFICIGTWMAATETYPLFADQRQCKDWARAGNYQMAEGRVTGLIRERGRNQPTHFKVGSADFTYHGFQPWTGGFHGVCMAPDAQDLCLREGLPVRIAYYDGRILRIEVGDSR